MGDDRRVQAGDVENKISIHVPRVGDDVKEAAAMADQTVFLSTSPVWGTTVHRTAGKRLIEISIHVPRVGDDIFYHFVIYLN